MMEEICNEECSLKRTSQGDAEANTNGPLEQLC